MDNKITGEFISTRRKELGLTQIQLAERLNVTDKAVSKWENGKSAPDISSLLPLAEILEVSVVEILSGKRMEQREVQEKSNITIVQTMRKTRRKLFVGILCAAIAVLVLISLYPLYQLCTTVATDDKAGIERMANEYLRRFEGALSLDLIQYEQKGDYLVALMQNESKIAMVVFERNHLFADRFSPCGGNGTSSNLGKIHLHSFGEKGFTVNVFYGTNISDEYSEYKFEYRGVEYRCPIEEGMVLDVFLDVSDSFTNPHCIEFLK